MAVPAHSYILDLTLGFYADVNIFGTGLDWLYLLINWTKRKVLKDKKTVY